MTLKELLAHLDFEQDKDKSIIVVDSHNGTVYGVDWVSDGEDNIIMKKVSLRNTR